MKTMSTAALAAMLMTGATAISVSVPVVAQEKPKEVAPLKLSPEVRVPAAEAQKFAQARDFASAEPFVVQAEAAAKTDDDRFAAATLRAAIEVDKINTARTANQPGDTTRLRAAYVTLLANPRTAPADAPNYAAELGLLYYNARQYRESIPYFERARQMGYNKVDLSRQIVMAKVNAGDVAGGMTELEATIERTTAAGGKADEQLYRYALSRTVAAKDTPGSIAWMRRYLTAYPTAKNWRDMIKIFGLQPGSLVTPSKAQSLDLYRLLRATKSLAGQYDYEDYALRANQLGLPYETRTIITEGRATGKIPSGSATATQMLATANNSIKIEGSLTPLEAQSRSAANGKLAAQTADALLGSGNYAKAAELYRIALEKGGANTNDVNTRLGIALSMTGDKAGAKAAFAAVSGAPGADIASLWSVYLDAAPVA